MHKSLDDHLKWGPLSLGSISSGKLKNSNNNNSNKSIIYRAQN